MLYDHPVTLVRVIDGDTVVVDIDLGFGIRLAAQHLRLYGINAPELSTTDGHTSKNFLTELLHEKTVHIETHRQDDKDKYGRWLATLWIIQDDYERLNVNDYLVRSGYALRYLLFVP